jgi:hypothetical protein
LHHALSLRGVISETTMKTRLLATGLLLVMSSVAFADRSPPGHPPRFDIDKLEVLLDLDAYQKSEVQKILDTQRDAMRAKREELRNSQTRPSFEQMQQEREAAQKSTRTELAKVLSEQQLKKYDVLSERPQMRRRAARDSEREKKE